MPTNVITALRHATAKVTKIWKADGTIEAGADAKYFILKEYPVASIGDLSKLLSDLEGDPHAGIIRGKYKGYEHSLRVEPETKRNRVMRRKGLYYDQSVCLLCVDVDNFKTTKNPLVDPWGACDEFILTSLPQCFHGVTYHFQLSSSAGHPSKPARGLRVHIWFWLKTPYTSAQLRAWAVATDFKGDKALFDPIQLHYTAAPVFEDGVDNPVRVRSGLVQGDFGDAVGLVIPEGILLAAGDGSAPASRLQKLQTARASDPIVDLLRDKGMVKGERKDGGLNIICPRHEYHTGDSGDSATIYYPAHTGGYVQGAFDCKHGHCREATQTQFREGLGHDDLEGVFGPLSMDAKGFESYGDISNGRRFAERFRGKLLYIVAINAWYIWTGQRWAPCEGGEEMAAAKAIAEECLSETLSALLENGTETAKRNFNQAQAVHRTVRRVEAMQQTAASEPGMSISNPGLFDANPWVIGVKNGAVNLRNAELLEPSPGMLVSRQAGAEYDRLAQCPMWTQTVHEVMRGDEEMVSFMQRLCGYALTGLVTEEKLFFFLGMGANGKSVFMNVIAAAVGEYAATVRAALLARDPKGSGSDAEREKCRLPGARIALMNETGQGDVWDDQRTKELVSRERISARQLYGESFDFMPTHKLFIRGNHQPGAMDNTDGFWRRIVLIGFTRQFPESERIPDLDRQIIEKELPGVLAWMVEGCLDWQKHGLQVPASIAVAVNTYRRDTDLMGEWIDACCTASTGAEDSINALFTSYEMFLKEANTKAPSRNTFGRQLVQRGFSKRKSNGLVLYTGIALQNPFGVDEL